MKPLIIYIDKNINDGKILLTKKELEEIVNEAYRKGVSDGSPNYYPYYPYSISTTTLGVNTTGTEIKNPGITTSCGVSSDSNNSNDINNTINIKSKQLTIDDIIKEMTEKENNL